MQSLLDWETIPSGAFGHLLFRFAPRIPILADSQLASPNDRIWLNMRLYPRVSWLKVRGLKICVSEMATLLPRFVMSWVLPNAFCSAKPGEPPGMNEVAWS